MLIHGVRQPLSNSRKQLLAIAPAWSSHREPGRGAHDKLPVRGLKGPRTHGRRLPPLASGSVIHDKTSLSRIEKNKGASSHFSTSESTPEGDPSPVSRRPPSRRANITRSRSAG